MDTGPIYSKRSVSVQPQWRSVELLEALSLEGPSAVHDALTMISTGQLPSAQEGQLSMAPKISKQDALLNFSEDAQTVVNAVRAFTYEPGAWCNWKNEPFKVTSATALDVHELKPGVIAIEGQRVIVGCGNNTSVEFLTVIPAGKKEMKAADWARGARLKGGESFG
jgi:methionyl-tRNA formyltransferase